MWRGSGRSGTQTRSRSCPGPSEWTLDTCHVLARADQAFLHPGSDERMAEVVLTEIIEDMDLDRDGEVSLEEYLADILEDEEAEEVRASERDNFSQHLDQDGDGRLSRGEVRTWLMPLQHDYASAEVTTSLYLHVSCNT